MNTHTLAFIGLGTMGMPMATHLMRAGHRIQFWARNPNTCAQASALGMLACNSPAQAAQGAYAVFSNVTATQDVKDVFLGSRGIDGRWIHGVIDGAKSGTLCIDHSTIDVQGSVYIADCLQKQGLPFLDAPVSGGEQGAIAGHLSVMVGGTACAFDAAKPLLACYGKTLVHVGPSGSGQVVKACNQMVQVINIQGIAEAMLFAQSHGVELAKVLACLSAGMAGSKMLDLMGEKMARADFVPGIQARLHHKDFESISTMAHAAQLQLPALQTTLTQLQQLMALGMGYDDTSSLLRVLEQTNPSTQK